MHVVTKFLVVLCALLCVMLSALTIAYASNADTIRRSIESALNEAEAARAVAKDMVSAEAQARQEAESNLATSSSTIERLTSELGNLRREVNEKDTALARAEQAAQDVQNQIGQLGATTDTQAKLIQAYRDEITRVREGLLSASKREVDLVDQIADLEAQREVLDQTTKALQEQLAELQYQYERALASGTGGVSTVATSLGGFESRGPLVRARVTRVFQSPSGHYMATISEGSSGGVRENMRMNVVRGADQFLAKLVIVQVDAQESVGRLDYLGRSLSAEVGDYAVSRLD